MSIPRKEYLSPVLCADFYLESFHNLAKKLRLENDLKELKKVMKRSLDDDIISILQDSQYDALVVTDAARSIVWVNNGFKEMTGYAKSFGIGKKPSFLQGPNTSKESVMHFRRNLTFEKNFKASLINYKKNGEEYLCAIEVFPLKNKERQTTHFLALERDLS